MNRLLFAWDRSRSQLRQANQWREVFTGLVLLMAAFVLCFLNLAHPDLAPQEKMAINWLNNWLNQEFLGMGLIMVGIKAQIQAHPWWIRLPNALLTALSIPLLYSLAKENFRFRRPALLSALIYLTFLPILTYTRMDQGNALILFLEITLFWCGLRSRRDLRWAFGVGLSAGMLILVDSWTGWVLIVGLFSFLLWDTPRLLSSGYFGLGSILGSLLPLGGLSGWRVLHNSFKEESLLLGILSELNPIIPPFSLDTWFKLLLFSLPWLIFVKDGFILAKQERHWSWAKLVIAWGVITFIGTGFHSFSSSFEEWLTVYPVFALAAGMRLSKTYDFAGERTYPENWSFSLFILALLTFIAGLGLYFNLFLFSPNFSFFPSQKSLILLTIALILTFTVSGVLVLRRNSQFIAILTWGMYVSLILWLISPHWVILTQLSSLW